MTRAGQIAAVCVFCKIACAKAEARIVAEDETWVAFEPLGPHAPGHVLFIPRRHVRDATVEPALTGVVMAAACAHLGRVLKGDGNILTSVGATATQTVMHLHIHVIPRGATDGLHHDWPWQRVALAAPEVAASLYRMNGFAWYGRDLGGWDDPESTIARNEHERDRWRRQAEAVLR